MRASIACLLAVAALGVAAAPAAAKTFKLADSGSTATVEQGDTFKVKLKQHSDGGYLWKVKKGTDAGILELVGHGTLPGPCKPENHCVGGFTWFVATYRAAKAGSTKINLVEKRSFEDTPSSRFKLGVTVQ